MNKKLGTLLTTGLLLTSTLAGSFAHAEEVVETQSFYYNDTLTETESNNSLSAANVIFDSQDYTGTISSGDEDFYEFTLLNDQEVYLSGNYGVGEERTGVWMNVYQEDGTILSSKEFAEYSEVLRLNLSAGKYYIHFSAQPDLAGTKSYKFHYGISGGYWYRLAGQDRYETAVDIAYRYADLTEQIVIATGQDFPDALAAGPLAKKLRAPILLTRKDELPVSVKDFISNGGQVKKATIIGGTNVVSVNVENYLKSQGIQVERIAGANRYETAAMIADRLVNVYGEKTAYLVNGRNFPDALSISPVAALEGAPILLTESTSIPAATASKLANYDDYYIIGGPNAVSEQVEAQLPNTIRIYGANRYETSALVAYYFSDMLSVLDYAYMATGANFADALAGSVLAASYQGPLLLTPSTSLHEGARSYIEDLGANQFVILGGKNAVNDDVVAELRSLYQ